MHFKVALYRTLCKQLPSIFIRCNFFFQWITLNSTFFFAYIVECGLIFTSTNTVILTNWWIWENFFLFPEKMSEYQYIVSINEWFSMYTECECAYFKLVDTYVVSRLMQFRLYRLSCKTTRKGEYWTTIWLNRRLSHETFQVHHPTYFGQSKYNVLALSLRRIRKKRKKR